MGLTLAPPPPRASPPPVSAEFTGLARRFRSVIDAEDSQMAAIVTAIRAPLVERFQRGKRTIRPETLADIARRWRVRIPQAGRLDLRIERGAGSLVICETRASAGSFRFVAWGTDAREPDIGIIEMMLDVKPGHWECRLPLLASVSMHALGRWHQRNFATDDDALRADLREIAVQHAAIMAGRWDIGFSIECNSGRWVGEVVKTTDREGHAMPLLSIRSFLN